MGKSPIRNKYPTLLEVAKIAADNSMGKITFFNGTGSETLHFLSLNKKPFGRAIEKFDTTKEGLEEFYETILKRIKSAGLWGPYFEAANAFFKVITANYDNDYVLKKCWRKTLLKF